MNNYHIYDEIAKGNHCVIYKSRRKQTIDYYAVKSLEKCRRTKLMNEVKVASALEHENVLRFHNWYETKNHLWVISEYASGGNLFQLLEQDKKFTEDQVRIFSRDLIQGLFYLHSKGVLYCDLKPSKILLNEYGTLKFSDFGLAKRIVDLIQSPEEIKEGSKKGTPSYMSPELFEEDGVFSIQSDIWALGCLIYEMAAGKPPFESDTFQGLVHKVTNEEPIRVTGFTDEYHQLIQSLLDKNPLRRISWSQIFTHSFFRFNSNQIRNLLSVQIPQQTHFERWASLKYSQQHQRILESNKSSKEGSNVLRISLNAKKNFRRELQDEAGFKALEDAKGEGDFILPNRDQNIDIGGYSTQNGKRLEVENQTINIEQQNQNYNNSKTNFQLLSNNNNSNSKITNYPSIAPAGNIFFSNTSKSSQGDSDTYLKNYNNIENLNRIQVSTGKQEGGKSQTMLTPSRTDALSIASNQAEQIIVLPSSNLQPTLQPQISTQILNSQSQQRLMNSSKFQQTPAYTQRQGSQTPTSPNNLQRTPSNPKYDSNTMNYLATTNFSSRNNNHNNTLNTNSNSNSSRQPNHAQTPQTPSSQHAKSVSPYHGSATRSNQKAATLKNIPNTSYGNSIYNSNNPQSSSPYSSNPLNQNNINSQYFHHSHTLSSTNTNLGVSPLRNNSSQKTNGGTQITSTSPIGKRGPIQLSNNKQIPFNQPQSTDKKVASIAIEPIEKLLVHPSDNQVKPIIGHSDIEKEEETLFKSESLPFTSISADEIERNPTRPEIDSLFGQIFTALHQGNTDKYNILCYFESIIKNSTVANQLLNSAFASFLLEIIQTSKSPLIRLRAVSCIGFLLRFATAIDTQLSSLNLPGVILVALSTEIDIKVRRKLLATIGEYLFYAATQVDEDPQGSAWRIDQNCLNYLLHLIRNTEEDEIVRFYACKTIENIVSQSVSVGVYFCTPEGVSALIQVFYSCKTEELKSCVLTGLCHICRQQPMLTSSVIEYLGGQLGIVNKIKSVSNSGKTIQSCLTLLNSQLYQLSNSINPSAANWLNQRQISLENNSSNLSSSPTEHVDTVLDITNLLNSGQSVIRSKTILAMCMLIKLDPWCLVALSQTKFYTQLDKLLKETQKYVFQAFHHMNNLLQSTFPALLQQLQSDISRLSEGQMLIPIPQSVHLQQMLPGYLPFLKVIIQLAGCSQSIVKQLFTDSTLNDFFDLFSIAHASREDSLSQAKDLLMNLSETILSNQPLVIDKLDFFLTVILPKLLDSLSHCMIQIRNPNNNSMNSNNSNSYYHNNSNSIYNSQNNISSSSKFNCVKLIHDIIVVFAPEWSQWPQQALQRSNELFIHQFIEGILPSLLITPEEPIKLLVFRIIQTLVETQPMLFVAALRAQNLISHLLSQFTFTASRSALRITSKITAASSFQEILSYDLITRAGQLLQHFYSRQQDQCLEDTLDVLITACSKAMGNKQNNSNQQFNFDKPSIIDFPIDQIFQIQHQESLINTYPTCCCLMSSSDPSLIEKSVILIIYLLHFFSNSSSASLSFNTMVLRNDCISQIINSIVQTPSASRNIRVLNWIVQLVAIPKQLRDSISSSLNKLLISQKDPNVVTQGIRELMYYLRRE